MPEVSELVPFKSGYHLHDAGALVRGLTGGQRVWLAEGRGESLPHRSHFVVYASARLVRELDWSLPTRLRLSLAIARDAIACASVVEPCLLEALAEAEAREAPTVDELRAIDAKLLQPTFPRRLRRWEEEIEDDPEYARAIRAASDRYLCVSWALAAEPTAAMQYARGVIADQERAQAADATFEASALDALLGSNG